MRSDRKILIVAAVALLVTPQLSFAEDVQEQLRKMQERMNRLEEELTLTRDRLEASEARVNRQQGVIERAGLGDRSGSSGLSRFLRETEISGFVAASWNYNFNNPDTETLGLQAPGGVVQPADTVAGWNAGALGLTAPLHSNPNSFQVDALWFSLRKRVDEESRGGWGADIVFGANADAANAGIWGIDDAGNVGSLPHLFQAYVSYLAPIGSGIEIRAGRWETPLGAESFRQDRNFNITRGIVWSLQPVNHTGVLFSGAFAEDWSWALGVANQMGNTMADTDHSKTGVGQIKWKGETFGFTLNGLVGGDVPLALPGAGNPGRSGVGRDADYIGIVDLVATWDPSDELSTWLNFDTFFAHGDGIRGNVVYALAGASRLLIAENTHFSLRGEYVFGANVFDGSTAGGMGLPSFVGGGDAEMYAITGTVEHALTNHLTLRVEGRYDKVMLENLPDDFFVGSRDPDVAPSLYTKADQVLALVEILYEF